MRANSEYRTARIGTVIIEAAQGDDLKRWHQRAPVNALPNRLASCRLQTSGTKPMKLPEATRALHYFLGPAWMANFRVTFKWQSRTLPNCLIG